MKPIQTFKYSILLFPVLLYYLSISKELPLENKQEKKPDHLSLSSKNEVKVCTQNIFRLGDKGIDSEEFYSQLKFLVGRIAEAECSVVALQEVPGNLDQSRQILKLLSKSLDSSFKSASFEEVLGPSNDPYIRNAYIYDSNKLRLLGSRSLYHDSVPRLSSRTGPGSYVRGPLMVEFDLLKKTKEKSLVLINYHLKSKSRGFKDKSGLDFEISRLLSASGIRERINEFMKKQSSDYVELLLGDRNADSESATARIFTGELDINDFRGSKSCEIIPSGEPVCEADHYGKSTFKGVLETKNKAEDLDLVTHSYRGRGSILDEIYISEEDFDRTLDLNGKIRAGVVGDFRKGSDHLLAWTDVALEQ